MAISNATKVAPFANGDLASAAFQSPLLALLLRSLVYLFEEQAAERNDQNQKQENSPDESRSKTTCESLPTLF